MCTRACRSYTVKSHHDLAVVLFAEVGNQVQATGGGQGEFNDVEAAVNCRLHGLCSRILGWRAQHRACAILCMQMEGVTLSAQLIMFDNIPSSGQCFVEWTVLRDSEEKIAPQ